MIVITYVVYIAVSLLLTLWVGRTLFKNGRVFLVDVFSGNEAMADSVNHLLVVGFYLVNLGFISLFLKIEGEIPAARGSIESLSTKLGVVMLVLGAMHFFNLGVFSKVRAQQLARKDQQEWRKSVNVPPVVSNWQ
jgi:hypothetical protein